MPTVFTPPVSTYVPLATITLTSTDSNVTFSNIPQTYRDLIFIANGAASSNGYAYPMRINGDSGANYNAVVAMVDGSIVFSYSSTNATSIPGWNNTDNWRFMYQVQLFDYSATDKHKTGLHRFNQTEKEASMTAFRWASTSAVTSFTFLTSSGSFAAGTTFSLYGIE